MHSLPFKNQTLAIVVKNHTKVDIKHFLSCPILLDSSIQTLGFDFDLIRGDLVLETFRNKFSCLFYN